MAPDLSRYRQGRHSRYQSSEAVLAAIEAVSGEELPEDGTPEEEDRESDASRIWSDPTPEEMAAVEAKAWEYAGAEDDVLFWGEHKMRRPNPR